ncbi:hypothetical protein SAMN04515668_4892 [Hymenobacter arizonensis]|uniref:Uncharacterized protein n=2 Tax=Hymenobacter arizonensis TaxID=1227077 RepID=A0A1I6BQ46_HYMAR|nr:hypothetical protein SAMN04515668_4892 [Hymenobacter arizonensis]
MAGAIVLIAALFVATLNNEALYAVLGQVWRQAFFGVGLSPRDSAAMVSQVSGQVTNTARDAPAVLIYGALYVGTCLALLWLVLPAASQRRLALTFYGGATLLFVVLLGAGQLGSSVLLQLSSQLIHFIVSPLPVIGLVPLLRWYLPHKQPF